MPEKYTTVERERKRLHQLASEKGLCHNDTLSQSQLLDRLVVQIMKNQINKGDQNLRPAP